MVWAELGLTPGLCDPKACVLESSGEQLESCKSKLRDKWPQLHLSFKRREKHHSHACQLSTAERGTALLSLAGPVIPGLPWASTRGLWLSLSLLQHINPVAASLIQKMLQTDPTARPTVHELLSDEFFTSGYIPARLPITCLTIPPRFSIAPSSLDPSNRKPLSVLNKGKTRPGQTTDPSPQRA